MTHTLSKSDYKVARTCPTKLYYRELGYPTTDDDSEYLRLLADGGYMVEQIARLLYPDGRLIRSDNGVHDAARQTMEALRAENVELFQATLLSGHKLARVDILRKAGNEIELIEVKAKSFSGDAMRAREAKGSASLFRTAKGEILQKWREHLEDLAFQVMVLQELLPSVIIRPYLMLPDTSKTTSVDVLHQRFIVRREERGDSGLAEVTVEFTGDSEKLRAEHFVATLSVETEIRDLLPEVRASAEAFVASLQPVLKKIETPLSVHCKDCEFRAPPGDRRDGFLECWGDLGRETPHIFDLFAVGTVGPKEDPLANQLIREGKTNLGDIPTERLVRKDGTVGATNERQLRQIRHSLAGTTWMSEQLPAILCGFVYPLHFLDFETSCLVVPYHAGMRPYQTVAFQWSCHTLPAPDSEPIHREWLNTEDFYPNVHFASALRACLGKELQGTVFMWSNHERTTLRCIAAEMRTQHNVDQSLAAWIYALAGTDGDDKGKLVDMNEIAKDHFFHPHMGGSTSIKNVLDAVWATDAELQREFSSYVREENGNLLSPYRSLPPLLVAGVDVSVREGTGAMRAYQHMLYGAGRDDPAARDVYRQLLRQYCELDTAAMLMIWRHWSRLALSTSMP